MRSSQIIIFCLLATALYFVYASVDDSSTTTITITTTTLTSLRGRRPLRALAQSSSNQQDVVRHKFKVDREKKKSTNQAAYLAKEYGSSNKLEELVYHTDYHGVTTHPTPNPKHPKP